MAATTKQTQRDYFLAFKLVVVNQVDKSQFTYKQAQKIRNLKLLKVRLRKHGN